MHRDPALRPRGPWHHLSQRMEKHGTATQQKPEVTTDEWYDEEGDYCIMQPHNPEWSLCGLHIPDAADIEDDEVPDEVTCKECLAIKVQQGKKRP